MKLKSKAIKDRITVFEQRFGKPHLHLAYHAALPTSLTPDLLYRIWANFKQDNRGKSLEIPFHAVADILISLCENVGYELYEMDLGVRDKLLKKLKADPHFGDTRIEELATFLIDYTQPLLTSEDEYIKALVQVQRWTALAYIDARTASAEIARAFQQMEQQEQLDFVWMESMVKSLETPLGKQSELVRYAQGMGSYVRGDLENAVDRFMSISQWREKAIVSGVSLPIPEKIRHSDRWRRRRFLKLTLFTLLGVGGYWGYHQKERRKFKVFGNEVVSVNAKGKIIKKEILQFKYFTEQLKDEIGLDMAEIPGGSFLMGTEDEEIARLIQKYNAKYFNAEKPQHKVNISSFFMGKSPITQAQWRAIASRTDLKVERDLKPDPSYFKGDDRPVEQVNWYDAVEFCKRFSKLSKKDYRLPSEAEWEYACRAGTTTPFYFGETITGDLANYDVTDTYADEPKGKYRGRTTTVGQFPPNAFGLYDMHGNVWEWCADDWHDNYQGAPTDRRAWLNNNDNHDSISVLRGGSWYDFPGNCRSAYRYNSSFSRGNHSHTFGFRVVCGVGRTLSP